MVSENEIKEMFLPSVFKTSLLLLDYCSEKQGNYKKQKRVLRYTFKAYNRY